MIKQTNKQQTNKQTDRGNESSIESIVREPEQN